MGVELRQQYWLIAASGTIHYEACKTSLLVCDLLLSLLCFLSVPPRFTRQQLRICGGVQCRTRDESDCLLLQVPGGRSAACTCTFHYALRVHIHT
jgi:hypothetical protein